MGNYNFFSSGVSNQNFFADYASIRNGSYGRLLKSYYGMNTKTDGSVSGSTKNRSKNILDQILEERKNPPVSAEVQKANSSLTSDISALTSSVKTLQAEKTYQDSENGATAVSKVTSAVKSFVDQYNSTVKDSKKSTLTSKTSNVAAMMRATEANTDKLAEIGIKLNKDGTLMLDEKKLKATDVSKVQELFSAKDVTSYGSTVMSRLKFASAAGGTTATKPAEDTKTEETPDLSVSSLKEASKLLASDKLFATTKDESGNDVYDIDQILASTKSFIDNYNSMIDSTKNSGNSGVVANVSRIKEKTAQNSGALKQFGITMDMNYKLKLDEDTFKKADMSKVQKLFKNYGESIASSASLVDYYMTTQADATKGYTAEGLYNVQGNARYADYI